MTMQLVWSGRDAGSGLSHRGIQAQARSGGRVACISAWAAHSRGRLGNQQAVLRHGKRGDLSHLGGRDRTYQRSGMARPRRTAAARVAGVKTAGGIWVLERQGEVTHLIAWHLKDLTPHLGNLVT